MGMLSHTHLHHSQKSSYTKAMNNSKLQVLSETIQNDILYYLDGIEDLVIEDICDIIVTRFDQIADVQSVNIPELNSTLSYL